MLRLYGRGSVENRATKARDLDWEAGLRRTRTELAPALWKSEEISQEEGDGLADWSLAAHAPALSAVMARIHSISYFNTAAELEIKPLNGCPRLSWWGKPSLNRFVALLTTDDLKKVYGAKSMPAGHDSHVLHLDGAALELRGPIGDE